MNKISRTLRLYIKTAQYPFTIGFGVFIMLGMAIAFIVVPDPVGSKEYLSMLGAIQMGHIGTVFVVVIANDKLQQNKFYSSCSCAKELFIICPVVVMTVLNLFYDIVIYVSAYINLGIAGLSDVLVFNSFSSAMLIIVGACHGKQKLGILSVIPYCAFLAVPMIVNKSSLKDATLGISVGTAALIAAGWYIATIIISIVLERIWWKRGDKFVQPNKFVQSAIGGQ